MTQQETQRWDASQYAANGRFVADLAGEVVGWLNPQPGERVLDLGCGDGALTVSLTAAGAVVTGVELDPSMTAAARGRGLTVVERSMTALEFDGTFNAVFSNAALHWVRDQPAVVAGVHRALVPGGRFVAEMGGLGNIAAIRVALAAVCRRCDVDAEEIAQSYFPSAAQYRTVLQEAGFTVERIELIPRPTLVKAGMAAWLHTFRRAVLAALPEADRDAVVNEVVALLEPVLRDDAGTWWADYVRLRFIARRDSQPSLQTGTDDDEPPFVTA